MVENCTRLANHEITKSVKEVFKMARSNAKVLRAVFNAILVIVPTEATPKPNASTTENQEKIRGAEANWERAELALNSR